MDFRFLTSAERFENLCKQILFIIYPNLRVKTIDGRGGDSGTDSFIGTINDQQIVFQFKWFTESLKSSHWNKIKDSLRQSSTKNPQKWVLFIPTEFKESDWRQWEEQERLYPGIKLELLDKPLLQHLVLANQHMLALEFSEMFPNLEVARIYQNLTAQTRQQALPFVKTDQTNLPIISRYESRSLQHLSDNELQRIRSDIEKFKELFHTMGIQPVNEEEKNVKFLSRLALYDINSERYDNAIFIFDLILREYPDDLRTLNNKAVVMEGKGNPNTAFDLLNEALRIFPDFTDAIINRALMLIDSEINSLEGLKVLECLFNQTIEHQMNKNILVGLMKGYSGLGDSEKTLYYYEKAKCANVGKGILNNILGTAYFNAGKFYQALEMFESIIAKDHDNIDILINISAALVELGLGYLAQSILEKVIKQKPNCEGAITNLALAYHKQNKFDLAIIYGEWAYLLNDYDYINLNNLGLFYSAIGDYEKAIDCFNRTLIIKKDFVPALHNKAEKLYLLGKLEEALQCIEELLKYDPVYLGEFHSINVNNRNIILKNIEAREKWPKQFK